MWLCLHSCLISVWHTLHHALPRVPAVILGHWSRTVYSSYPVHAMSCKHLAAVVGWSMYHYAALGPCMCVWCHMSVYHHRTKPLVFSSAFRTLQEGRDHRGNYHCRDCSDACTWRNSRQITKWQNHCGHWQVWAHCKTRWQLLWQNQRGVWIVAPKWCTDAQASWAAPNTGGAILSHLRRKVS